MSAEPIPVPRAVGTAKLAQEFLAAAKRNGIHHDPPSFVTYFLIGHSLELALKAALVAEGTTEGTLKHEIRHDLENAARKVEDIGPRGPVPLDDDDWERIALLNPIYRAKAFEYLEPGFARLPVQNELYEMASRLVNTVAEFVDGRVRASLSAEDECEDGGD